MKKGDFVNLEILTYAFEGKGIAKIDSGSDNDKKYVVFVENAYPGDIVEARIKKVKKSYAEASLQKIIKESEHRTEASCNYFGLCGGCKQQNMKYESQLNFKEEQVKDIFDRIGGLSDYLTFPIIASEKQFFYRNKMEFSFTPQRWLTKEEIDSGEEIKDANFSLGLHVPKVFSKTVNIEKCFLQSDESNEILNLTRDFFKSRNVNIYSTFTHSGFLRHLVIKQSHHTKDLMVNLVSSEFDEQLMNDYKNELIRVVPQISTIVNNITSSKANISLGEEEFLLHGPGYIFDSIGDCRYKISANSFFQTNTLQADNLYKIVAEFAQLKGEETVYDLYSGAGTITLYLSNAAKQIIGFESVESAISDAEYNSNLNNRKNTKFIKADLNKSFLPKVKELGLSRPDIIIADPPRSGMNPKTIKDIIICNSKKIVYVSCNPTTQARDIKLLSTAGYKLIKIQPVDMFPHTYHVENVALLER